MSLAIRKRSELQQTMEGSVTEGVAFSLMVSLGETYFPAFVLAAHLGEIASGLIVTLPLLVGATLQLFSSRLLPYVGSYRRWVVMFTSLQGLSLAPLIYYAFHGGLTLPMMFFCAVFYWGAGMLAGPCWNTWITSIVPPRVQTQFFARRNRGMQTASLIGFLVGGFALRYLPQGSVATAAFAPLFAGALLARCFSVLLLLRQRETAHHPSQECFPKETTPLLVWNQFQQGTNYGRIVAYLFVFQFAVHTASPFINPYLLHHIGFTYAEYALLITSMYFTKILVLPFVGSGIRKRGCEPYLKFGGTFIAVIPALFMVSQNFYWLLVVQLLSGVFWAAFDLSSLLTLLNSLPQKNRTAFLSYFHFCNALALALSSLAGGFLLRKVGLNGYMVLFAISAFLRGSTILFLRYVSSRNPKWNQPKPVAPVERAA